MGEPSIRDANGVPCLIGYEVAGTEALSNQSSPNLKRLHVATTESDLGGTTVTQNALLVSDLATAGGEGGPTTVTANQGDSGAEAWPVQISGSNTVVVSNTTNNTVTGTVSVNNFPTSQAVAVTNAPDVGVTAIPAVSIAADQSISADVTALPDVAISANQSISVNVTNTPDVGVTNFPTSQAVAVTNSPTVVVDNTETNTVTGTVSINNFPTSVFGANVPDGFSEPSLHTFATISTGSVSVVAAPGANNAIYIRGFDAGNEDPSATVRLEIRGGTSTVYLAPLAQSAGGRIRQFVSPLSLPVNSGLTIALNTSVGEQVDFNVEYFTRAT